MELYEEILAKYFLENGLLCAKGEAGVDYIGIVDQVSYKTLQKIKAVLEDDSLEDEECFMKIEEIVCIFEELGSGCGSRHDFG